MSRELPIEDLLVLARQRKLSEGEERRLEIALQSSRELECLYDAGAQFDQEASLLSGDETRFSRLVERTLERIDQSNGAQAASAARLGTSRSSGTALIMRYFAASLGVGLLLCVTLASAWDYVEKRAAMQAQQARESAAQAVARRRQRPTQPPPAPGSAPAPVEAASGLAKVSGEPPHALPASPAQRQKLSAAEERLSSSELFASANQARRKGDIEEAISLYERLGRAYPSSLEAEDAKILRGNLLLSQRSPRAALRQFEDYHSGALSLEALWGRAQALRKLESPDEMAILVELIRDYPASPYAEAAKRRLRELAR